MTRLTNQLVKQNASIVESKSYNKDDWPKDQSKHSGGLQLLWWMVVGCN